MNANGFPDVDHVELFGPPSVPGANSRNFVLCPGRAYDRSPCGTGTSAKLACLAADGELAEGVTLRAGDKLRTVACDYLACAFGLVANLELPELLGCRNTSLKYGTRLNPVRSAMSGRDSEVSANNSLARSTGNLSKLIRRTKNRIEGGGERAVT